MQYEEKKRHISLEENPLVSIITPLYNAEKFIAQTIASVQQQSYIHWEHIIVDDASTDASVKIVQAHAAKDERIMLRCLDKNQGAAVCRNIATEQAKGRFIAFLDADDLWLSEKLETQLSYMIDHKNPVSYTSYLHMDEKSKPLNKRIKALPSLSYRKQHSNNYVGNLTGIYNASVLGKIIAPSIRKRQDWAVWLEAIKRAGKPAIGLQKDLAYYRVRRGSISSNKINLIAYNYKFYKEHLGHSSLKSLYFLARFFWEYFLVRPKQIENL